jgi:hypothetical protein
LIQFGDIPAINPNLLRNLYEQVAEGNSDAFARFYDIYLPKVYRFARYFIKSDENCEEIVSDVFITLWTNKEKLPSIENMEACLFTVTKTKLTTFLVKMPKSPLIPKIFRLNSLKIPILKQ